MNKDKVNILLGIGGSGPSKRISPEIFISLIEKILKKKDCHFFLATGQSSRREKNFRKNNEFWNW
jgi:heptosyltransferase-2